MRNNLTSNRNYRGFSFFPIETHGTTLGMADLLFAGGGVGGVVELKNLSGKALIKVPYRQGQRSFLNRHYKGNPRTYVLAHYIDWYWLICGRSGFPAEYADLKTFLKDVIWDGEKLDKGALDAMVDYPAFGL